MTNQQQQQQNNDEQIDIVDMRRRAFESAQVAIQEMAIRDIQEIVALLSQNNDQLSVVLSMSDNGTQIASLQSLFLVLSLILNNGQLVSFDSTRNGVCQSSTILVEAIKNHNPLNDVSYHTYQMLKSYFISDGENGDNSHNVIHPEFTPELVFANCGGQLGEALYRWCDAVFTVLSVRFSDADDQDDQDMDDQENDIDTF
ncbi:hypothetical protein DFA_00350 [Cavenderia fasciculata]|uniref:Uncharacterized protein n=1 Tax=Cavenderia fasciculata TaxID=261658 RepID=F4PRD7_CACFS|nr:uncharacterized protein DFA_00350 [Cavenderia fasciculata]EGG20489.1 hypothetical protein DFA_00350 [Cavenderia fasciculata]|eukprot:XP_004358339.1 hypothetical protein DFA_00350 [Cavenderia fasciculata]